MTRTDLGFRLRTAAGRTVHARRVLVATGLVDELPEVPGLREHWGRGVVHCPFCHGWEVRGQAIGVLATSPMAVHQALLFSSMTDDLILFAHDRELAAEDRERLAAVGARVVDGEIAAVESADGRLTGVRLVDGTRVARGGADGPVPDGRPGRRPRRPRPADRSTPRRHGRAPVRGPS